MKKLFALSALVCMVLLSSAAFSEELKLSLSVEDVQPELTANRTAVNAQNGVSIDAVIITATKGANLTWSVTPALISGLASRISGDKFVISGAPAGGTKGTHAHTITAKNSKGSAAQNITITVSGQNVSSELIASDGHIPALRNPR